MAFSKEELEKLRQELPRGSYRKIANKLDLSEGSVKNAFTHGKNENVILAALEIIEKYKSGIELAQQKIAAI